MRITKGDLEITKNVVTEISKKTYKKIKKFEYTDDNFNAYQSLADTLVIIEKFNENLDK